MKTILSLACALIVTVPSLADEFPCTAASLRKLKWCELEQIYRQAGVGKVPCGYLPGKTIHCSKVRTCTSNLAWKGKHFSEGCMVNQWAVGRKVEARVYIGESWLDGKPSIILDYRGRKGIWEDARDEIREVAPGVYLGIMYRERCDGPKLETYFVLGCQ